MPKRKVMLEAREAQAVEKLAKDLGAVKDEEQSEDRIRKLDMFTLFKYLNTSDKKL